MNLEDIRDAILEARDEGHEPIAIECGPDVGRAVAQVVYEGPRRLGTGAPAIAIKELFGYRVEPRAANGFRLVFPRAVRRLRAADNDDRHGVEWVEEALRGPWCIECKRVRTKNPTNVCFDCLGDRRCPTCRGTAENPRRFQPGAGLDGCPACDGDGLRR